MELLNQFEELIKERTVVFDYDKADGFFIRVTGKGQYDRDLTIAEISETHHPDIVSAITAAVDYLRKEDAGFAEKIRGFAGPFSRYQI